MRWGLLEISGVYGSNFAVAVTPDDKIVAIGAWTVLSFASNTYGLCWAVVHSDYRRKGINASMVDYRLEQIRNYNKAPAYDVIVRTWDNPLYRSRGFVPGFQNAMKHKEGKCLMLAHFETEAA